MSRLNFANQLDLTRPGIENRRMVAARSASEFYDCRLPEVYVIIEMFLPAFPLPSELFRLQEVPCDPLPSVCPCPVP